MTQYIVVDNRKQTCNLISDINIESFIVAMKDDIKHFTVYELARECKPSVKTTVQL